MRCFGSSGNRVPLAAGESLAPGVGPGLSAPLERTATRSDVTAAEILQGAAAAAQLGGPP
jgi:hypothetical protein